jgi:hypothetical protein
MREETGEPGDGNTVSAPTAPEFPAPPVMKFPEATRVVKAPVFGVVLPMVPGVSHGIDVEGRRRLVLPFAS